jgi:hypothetical protein
MDDKSKPSDSTLALVSSKPVKATTKASPRPGWSNRLFGKPKSKPVSSTYEPSAPPLVNSHKDPASAIIIDTIKPLKDMMSLSAMKGTPKQLLLFVIVSTLSIIILILLFNKQALGGTTAAEITASVLFVASFTFFIVFFCFSILPTLQDWRLLFSSMFYTSFVILFTLALTLVFTIVSKETLDSYAYIFAPITLLIGIGVFYKGLANDYTLNLNNTMQEQIKTMIIMSCLLVVMVISYSADPGNFLHNTYNSNAIITLTITFLTFMYLFVRLIISSTTKNFEFKVPETGKWGVLFDVLYVIFLLTAITGIAVKSSTSGFMDDKPVSSSVISLLLVTTIIWSTNFFVSRSSNASGSENPLLKKFDNIFNNQLLIGIMMLLLGIWAIVSGVQKTNSTSTIVFILMMALVAFFIYKFYYTSLPFGNSPKAGFFALIINIILYIPCLLFDFSKFMIDQYKKTTWASLIIILVTSVIATAYLTLPLLFDRINLQGGNQLQNEPLTTDTLHEVSTYDKMNGINEDDYKYEYDQMDESGNKVKVTLPTKPGFKYQYGLSFWVYLNAEPPNTNLSYAKDTSLLNYGNKPNIRYNAQTNTFSVVVVSEFQEMRQEIVVYESKTFPLQRWNNIVINYLGGTMDIFLNGELVKSEISVVPYMSLDKLVVGEEDGIHGKVCNIVYFKQPLTTSKMYYLYNMVKDSSPPTTYGGIQILPSMTKQN